MLLRTSRLRPALVGTLVVLSGQLCGCVGSRSGIIDLEGPSTGRSNEFDGKAGQGSGPVLRVGPSRPAPLQDGVMGDWPAPTAGRGGDSAPPIPVSAAMMPPPAEDEIEAFIRRFRRVLRDYEMTTLACAGAPETIVSASAFESQFLPCLRFALREQGGVPAGLSCQLDRIADALACLSVSCDQADCAITLDQACEEIAQPTIDGLARCLSET